METSATSCLQLQWLQHLQLGPDHLCWGRRGAAAQRGWQGGGLGVEDRQSEKEQEKQHY